MANSSKDKKVILKAFYTRESGEDVDSASLDGDVAEKAPTGSSGKLEF